MACVSILIPAMDEEETIGLVLDDIQKVVAEMDYAFDIIVIDDHSKDRTAEIALSKGAEVIRNNNRPGKGNSLKLGFKQAKGDFVIMMDADYSHRAEDIPLLLKGLDEGAGLVIGSRIYGGSEEYTRIRALGNLIFTYLFGAFHGRYLSDALNGFKAFRREVFTSYKYTSSDFEIEVELLVNALRLELKILEVPSHERTRAGGKVKSRVIKHGFKFLFRILWEWVRTEAHFKIKLDEPR